MKSATEVRSEWLAQVLSTAAADRPRAEAAVRQLYAAAGFAEPRHLIWFDSPCAASWPIALLASPYDFTWKDAFGSGLSKDDRTRADKARSALGAHLGLGDWAAVQAAVGAPRTMSMQYPPVPSRILSTNVNMARFEGVDDVSALFVVHDENEPLTLAENNFWGGNRGVLQSALHCPTTNRVLASSFYTEYSFSAMADDEHRAGSDAGPMVRAAWDVARSAGLWWPFENAAFLTDRPTELYVNERKLLHRGDGPAAVYRDGWKVFAWNGKAVPERWIMAPESVPPREYKGFDPTFRKHVESRGGKAAPAGKKSAKPVSITKAVLPIDPAARLEQLRAHAGGKLPLFDRYRAGEHQQVWSELIALGEGVRSDPHAADALAVAYETMQRVDANVRTLVERLQALGYTFTTAAGSTGPITMAMGPSATRIDLNDVLGMASSLQQTGGVAGKMAKALASLMQSTAKAAPQPTRDKTSRPHVPPDASVRKELARFDKEHPLPLSLRAFYEVVGEVNLIGHHPSIAPKNNTIAEDPLVVYGFDEGAVEFDDEDGETPSAITIAPDELHKAGTSGGDAYEMAIPDLRADGELLNESHRLFFVDYLRLAFKFGGFPGYDRAERVPAELATLSEGLIGF